MTQLFDLIRSVVQNRGDQTYTVLPNAMAEAEVAALTPTMTPASPAPIAVTPADGASSDFVAISETLAETLAPAESLLESDENGALPEIFGDMAKNDGGIAGSADNFSFGTSNGGILSISGAITPVAGERPAADPVYNDTFDFDAFVDDGLIDFTPAPAEPPVEVTTAGVSGGTPAADIPVAGNNGGIPVHPVGCGCVACGGDGHDHSQDHDPEAYASDGGDTPTPVEGGPSDGFSVSSISTSGQNDIDSL